MNKEISNNKKAGDNYEIEDKMLEDARERDHKKRNKLLVPDKIEIFSVNDMW